MPIRRGESWGRRTTVPSDTPVAASDPELSALVRAGADVVALDGGDLWRTLGGRGGVAERLGREATLLDVDVMRVVADGREVGPAVAHVVARGALWGGHCVAAMNAQWLGNWDVAPRAHPGDGRIDVVSGRLDLRERLIARRRVRSGDHLPHPDLRVERVGTFEVEFETSRRLLLDGRREGTCTRLRIESASTVAVVV
jgi:hypothetical protein